MSEIQRIYGREIIDSRGNPTVEAIVELSCGIKAYASVPSGASTGSKEAIELRDGNKSRYNGKGTLNCINFIDSEINNLLIGKDPSNQRQIDQVLINLDGTENKSRLGANTILATSLAIAKASAKFYNMPLYKYMGGMNAHLLPRPMMNIINGGMHADNMLDIQEFMIAPISNNNIKDSIQIGVEIFHILKSILKTDKYNVNIGDEGGFAPNFNSSKQALDYIQKAITEAGYKPGIDVGIALDSAATELYQDNSYHLIGEDKKLTSSEFIEYYSELIDIYPIISIEDPLDENDLDGWKLITEKLGQKIQLVGDDLIVTNSKILTEMIDLKIANAVLIKPNQIGTLTETLDTIELAHKSGYKTIISHRSGETEDTTIAHIAVATNSGQIKTGSLCRTDRVAKYNELIRIEEDLNK